MKLWENGNYVYVLTDGSVQLRDSKQAVRIIQTEVDGEEFTLSSPMIGTIDMSIGSVTDDQDVAYTAETLLTFADTHTGNFSPASGGSEAGIIGIYDYNDSATAITPISVIGGAGYIDITNNELGAFTNKTYALNGVGDVWNASLNRFEWTQLNLGDTVDIRLDLSVNVLSVNTEVSVYLSMAEEAGVYPIPFSTQNYKEVGVYGINRFNSVYMGDLNTLNNPAKFKIKADKTCDLVVNGWYARVIKRN